MKVVTAVLLVGILAALAGWSGCRSSPSPEALFAEAEDLRVRYEKNASQQAIARYQSALAIWKRRGDSSGAARAGQAIGTTYEQLGRLRESLNSHGEALSFSRQSPDRLLDSRIRSDLGVAHARLGDFDQGRAQCQAALDLAQQRDGAAEQARALNCLGEVDYHRGNSREALAFYRKAEPLWARLNDTRGIADTLFLLGSAYSDLNDLDSASTRLREALSLWTHLGDERGQTLTRLALVRLHYFRQEHQESLNHLTKMMDRVRAAGDVVWEAACLSMIAHVYGEIGQPRTALKHWERAAELFESSGLQMAALETSVTIGTGYLSSDVSASLNWFERALQLARTCGNRHMESWALRSIGVAHLLLADPTPARRYLEQSLELQRSVEDPRFRAKTLADLGRVHQVLGDRARAMGYLRESLTLSQTCGDRAAQARALFELARVSGASNAFDVARRYAEAAIDVTESLRSEVDNRDLRASYVASVHQYHELHIDVLMQLARVRPREGLAAVAFAASERARARSLLESLAEARVDLRAGVDPDLLKREQGLKSRFDDWAARRARVTTATAARDAAALAAEYQDLEERYTQIQAEIRSKSPRYAALAQPQPLGLTEVQKQVLDADTLLLEYALGEERSYLWVVSQQTYTGHELPPRATIEPAAQRVYERLTARLTATGTTEERRRRIEQADAEYWQEATRLSAMLLGPVAKQLAGKRLLVVTDGALQYLPFAALPVPGSRDGPVPLVVEHEIVSLPSASVLAVLRRETRGRTPPARALAILADPVFESDDPRLRAAAVAAKPNAQGLVRGDGLSVSRLAATRQEADAIIAAVPNGMALKALDFDASRATAMSPELAQYRIVHFATHGVFDNENPGLSGVILSMFDRQGRPQDGFLRLHDIYNLHLPAELVVLSACNTALGQPVRGEGLVGIVRGFMYAGAKRVVASLWKVDDEATGELMNRFYREMLEGQRSPAAALRQAQLAMWQQARWQPPFHWAAFVLQGEWK